MLGSVWRTTGRPRLLAGDTFTSPVTFTAVGQSVFKATQSIMRNALSLMADECVTAPDSAAFLGDGVWLTSVNQQLKARGRMWIYIYWCNIYVSRLGLAVRREKSIKRTMCRWFDFPLRHRFLFLSKVAVYGRCLVAGCPSQSMEHCNGSRRCPS